MAKVEGFRELDRALGQLPKATARNTLNRALRAVAEPIAERWKSLAPREQGFLVQSIIVGPSSKLTRRQKADARKEGKYFAEIHIGSNDPAAMQQEFGNINHPAQRSGTPAWEGGKEKALDDFGKIIGEEIEKSAKRYAKKLAKSGG